MSHIVKFRDYTNDVFPNTCIEADEIETGLYRITMYKTDQDIINDIVKWWTSRGFKKNNETCFRIPGKTQCVVDFHVENDEITPSKSSIHHVISHTNVKKNAESKSQRDGFSWRRIIVLFGIACSILFIIGYFGLKTGMFQYLSTPSSSVPIQSDVNKEDL